MRSAWYSSTASITPDALAASRVRPLPCETASEREFGRHTMTTGMPIRSSPVTLAIRVIPMRRQVGLHAGESRGGIDRPVGAATIGLETGAGGLCSRTVAIGSKSLRHNLPLTKRVGGSTTRPKRGRG